MKLVRFNFQSLSLVLTLARARKGFAQASYSRCNLSRGLYLLAETSHRARVLRQAVGNFEIQLRGSSARVTFNLDEVGHI